MIRVLIAEDVHMIRGALVALLSQEGDIDVVAELDRGDQVLPTAMATRPDVAVLDIDLPGVDGITAVEELAAHLPGCRSLVLTGLGGPGYLTRALRAHARGFIIKTAPAAALAEGIRTIAAGGRVIDPELVAAAVEIGDSPLTAREAEVLRAAESGMSTDEIAHGLALSAATVRNYLSNAITKLGARNRGEAVRAARNAGWL